MPGGSGGGIPGSGGCTGLAVRFFSGRVLAKRQLNRVRVCSITRRTRLMRSRRTFSWGQVASSVTARIRSRLNGVDLVPSARSMLDSQRA